MKQSLRMELVRSMLEMRQELVNFQE